VRTPEKVPSSISSQVLSTTQPPFPPGRQLKELSAPLFCLQNPLRQGDLALNRVGRATNYCINEVQVCIRPGSQLLDFLFAITRRVQRLSSARYGPARRFGAIRQQQSVVAWPARTRRRQRLPVVQDRYSCWPRSPRRWDRT